MHKIIFLFSFIIILITASQTVAQKGPAEVMFIITTAGDSILTEKIFTNQTNENQVTFLLNGKPKTYLASEIKSYFKKSRKRSLYISEEKQYKLARITVRGPYQLAQAFDTDGNEKFYLQVKNEWINLDPHQDDLLTYLPTVLPDFKEGVSLTKIFYNSPSLGKAISRYNQFKDSDYTVMGFPGYTKKIKVGFLTSLGTSSLTTAGFANDFDPAVNFNLGTEIKLIYSRLLGLRIRMGFATNDWEGSELKVKLNTVNFATLVNLEFFRPSRKFGLSAAAGPNFIFDINTEIDDLTSSFDQPAGLSAINLGYDFQVAALFGKNLELFLSYQLNPSIKSPKGGLLNDRVYDLKVNTTRAGLIYYLK